MLIDPVVNIPISIEQGDSPSWVDYPFTDDQGNTYDSAVYTLTYTFAGPTAPLNVVGVATGTGWTTSLTPTQTGALTAGSYWWQAKLSATSPAVGITAARGPITIIPNLALQSAGYSGLSPAAQNLAAAQAQLASMTTTESYKIATREMKYRMTKDITDTIAYWNAIVTSENTTNSIAQNQGNPRKLYARFPGNTTGNWS